MKNELLVGGDFVNIAQWPYSNNFKNTQSDYFFMRSHFQIECFHKFGIVSEELK